MTEALQKKDPSLPARALSVTAFEHAIGGREVLFEILSQADITPEIQQLLGWLGDPQYKDNQLAYICRLAGLHPGEVFQAFERALQNRALVLARLPIAEKLPEVTADAMRRALTHAILCPDCNGKQDHFTKNKEGYVTRVECQNCNAGWIQQEPSLEQQKLALELGELLQKSGLQINNTQQIDQSKKSVTINMGSTLARLQASAADAAFTVDATEPTEGEVVPLGDV